MKHKNLWYLAITFAIIIAGLAGVQAQSITKSANSVTVSYPLEDYEKAVKASSAQIASKEGCSWTVDGVKWETTFINSMYILRRNGVEIYSSTTIAAIRAKYLSELLGIPFKNPS